jgi:hypothetical protein
MSCKIFIFYFLFLFSFVFVEDSIDQYPDWCKFTMIYNQNLMIRFINCQIGFSFFIFPFFFFLFSFFFFLFSFWFSEFHWWCEHKKVKTCRTRLGHGRGPRVCFGPLNSMVCGDHLKSFKDKNQVPSNKIYYYLLFILLLLLFFSLPTCLLHLVPYIWWIYMGMEQG